MQHSDILSAGQKKFPHLRGDAFLGAHQVGDGAMFLYTSVQGQSLNALDFDQVKPALTLLADRIAARLEAAQGEPPSDALAAYPHPHIVEVTQLLALVFDQPPAPQYLPEAVGARFWNWWHWASDGANHSRSAHRISELRREERLAAGAAALAMFHAGTPVAGRC